MRTILRPVAEALRKNNFNRAFEILTKRIRIVSKLNGDEYLKTVDFIMAMIDESVRCMRGKSTRREISNRLAIIAGELIDSGAFDQADQLLDQAFDTCDSLKITLMRGKLHDFRGEVKQAAMYYNELLIDRSEERRQAFRLFLDMAKRYQDWAGAFYLLNEDIKRFPLDMDLRLQLAELQMTHGKLEEAEVTLKGILALRPLYSRAASMLTRLLIDKGRLEDGEWLLRKMLEAYPNVQIFRVNLANVLVVLAQFEEASQLYIEVLAVNPKNTECLDGLAEIAVKNGYFEPARDFYLRAIRLDPHFRPRLMRYARLSYRFGEYGTALMVVNHLLEEPDETEIQILALKADIFRKQRRLTEALELCREILDRLSENEKEPRDFVLYIVAFCHLEKYKAVHRPDDFNIANEILPRLAMTNASAACGLVFLYGARILSCPSDYDEYFPKLEASLRQAQSLNDQVKDYASAVNLYDNLRHFPFAKVPQPVIATTPV
jgi:tetratricopeptide (TPR) repeat protein